MLKAVLFDLDGTLLPIDTDSFIKAYLKLLARKFSDQMSPEKLIRDLLISTDIMIENRSHIKTNQDVFIEDFMSRVGMAKNELEKRFQEFYDIDFPTLVSYTEPGHDSAKAVQAAIDAGLEVVIATKPVFPRQAIMERLKWINIDHVDYKLVTSYENMHYSKPHLDYYREILAVIGRKPEECLMIGNDVDEDLCAGKLGMHTVLVTDYVINKSGQDIKADLCIPAKELADIFSKGLF